MARAVTVTEFRDWVRQTKIMKLTWAKILSETDRFAEDMRETAPVSGDEVALLAKYFYLSLDTRDMNIFYIETNREDIGVRSGGPERGTILDVLEQKLLSLRGDDHE